jgi:hypothetical protein
MNKMKKTILGAIAILAVAFAPLLGSTIIDDEKRSAGQLTSVDLTINDADGWQDIVEIRGIAGAVQFRYLPESDKIGLRTGVNANWLTGTPGERVILEIEGARIPLWLVSIEKKENSLKVSIPVNLANELKNTPISAYAVDAGGAKTRYTKPVGDAPLAASLALRPGDWFEADKLGDWHLNAKTVESDKSGFRAAESGPAELTYSRKGKAGVVIRGQKQLLIGEKELASGSVENLDTNYAELPAPAGEAAIYRINDLRPGISFIYDRSDQHTYRFIAIDESDDLLSWRLVSGEVVQGQRTENEAVTLIPDDQPDQMIVRFSPRTMQISAAIGEAQLTLPMTGDTLPRQLKLNGGKTSWQVTKDLAR